MYLYNEILNKSVNVLLHFDSVPQDIIIKLGEELSKCKATEILHEIENSQCID